jgi:hypothetical protein
LGLEWIRGDVVMARIDVLELSIVYPICKEQNQLLRVSTQPEQIKSTPGNKILHL